MPPTSVADIRHIMQCVGTVFVIFASYVAHHLQMTIVEREMLLFFCVIYRGARVQLETKTGRIVVSPLSSKRYFEEQRPNKEIEDGEETEKKNRK